MASIYLRKNVYWISYYANGKKIQHSLKVKEKRKALYLKRSKEIEIEDGIARLPSSILTRDIFTKYKEHMYMNRTNKRSILGDIQQLEKFFNFCPPKIKDIKINHIQNYLLNLSKAKMKPKSINNYLVNIKTFFNNTKDMRYIHHSPAASLKKLHVPKNPPRYLSETEIRKLLKTSLETHLYPMLLTALYTGCRLGELTSLEWKDLDLKARILTVRGSKAKSKKFRVIPLTEKVCGVLKPTQNGCSYVFNYKGHRYLGSPRNALRSLLGRTGITKCGFHTLRHTCASHLVINGVDIYTVSKILGHSSVTMTEKYAHLSPNYLKLAVKRLTF